jgi:hypothetical protein
MLEREFDRFGAIQKIDHKPGDTEAFIQYESIDAATVRLLSLKRVFVHLRSFDVYHLSVGTVTLNSIPSESIFVLLYPDPW